jgi:predicted membrane GTPase involved in stress response
MIFERLADWYKKGKEKLGAQVIMDKVNKKINRIARILELKLEEGSANLTVELKGEKEQVNLSFKYALEENTICITNVKTNKEWLDGLADVFKEKYSKINLSVLGKKAGIVKFLINHLI